MKSYGRNTKKAGIAFGILNEKIDRFEISFNLYIQEPFISR